MSFFPRHGSSVRLACSGGNQVVVTRGFQSLFTDKTFPTLPQRHTHRGVGVFRRLRYIVSSAQTSQPYHHVILAADDQTKFARQTLADSAARDGQGVHPLMCSHVGLIVCTELAGKHDSIQMQLEHANMCNIVPLVYILETR